MTLTPTPRTADGPSPTTVLPLLPPSSRPIPGPYPETRTPDGYRPPRAMPKTGMPGGANRTADRRAGREAARTTPGCRVRRFA
jgi:hypothetical protein